MDLWLGSLAGISGWDLWLADKRGRARQNSGLARRLNCQGWQNYRLANKMQDNSMVSRQAGRTAGFQEGGKDGMAWSGRKSAERMKNHGKNINTMGSMKT